MKTEQEVRYKRRLKHIFSNNLLYLMNKNGYKQVDLAKKLDVSESTVSVWLNKDSLKLPLSTTIDEIALMFGVTRSDLLENKGSNIDYLPFVNVPLYESVSAGMGSTRGEAIGTFPVTVTNEEEAKNTLCVIVNGDSMSPEIENGDILQVRLQSSVDSGDIAIVLLDRMEHLVKKVEYGKDWIRLVSLNMNYKPILLEGADVQRCIIKGKVMAKTRRY